MLQNKHIKLRALEPEDLEFLFSVENNNNCWEVSGTQTPFSKYILKKYIENAHQDIYEAKQLRLVIIDISTNERIGLIDFFDFNPQHHRTGIGILILEKYKNKGFATQALNLSIDYSFNQLNLHQIYANILIDNTKSINLFKKLNFHEIGTKKDWIMSEGKFKDVILFQLINSKLK